MATTPQAVVAGPAGGSAAEQAWTLLHSLLGQQRRRFLIAASELELHPAQAGTLLQMQPGEPRPMHELAALLACDNSNVTGLIDRLEARGLVRRQPFEHDRRVKHVVLTERGEAVRARLAAHLGRPPAGLDRLSEDEQRQLRDLLRRVLED
jgi:DNA-binding MarR family transcriptional regulator